MRRFLAGIVVGIAATAAALAGVGHLLDVEDPLLPADAIVALSGDTGARTATAVELWKRRYAPLVIFAGASEDPESVSSGELMKREAIAAGVSGRGRPRGAVVGDHGGERQACRGPHVGARPQERHPRDEPYHQRRAADLFGRAFAPAKLTFRNYPARDPAWDSNTWWLHEPARRLTAVELAQLSVEVASAPFR